MRRHFQGAYDLLHAFHVSKAVPEDSAICAFDHAHQRVLVEGISHRYLIRGRDVAELKPVESGAAVAAQISYHVVDRDVSLVVYVVSARAVLPQAAAAFPVLGLVLRPFAPRARKRFVRRLASALRVEITPVR